MAARRRVSAEQLEALVGFMEAHPQFAAGKLSVYSRFTTSKLWRLLAERLNAAAGEGGAAKSPDRWCRFWADLKYKARKKAAADGDLGELSPLDERVNAIFSGAPLNKMSAGGADDEPKQSGGDEESWSEAGGAEPGTERLATEELLAEAAMRSALAAEKQAEAAAQAVELLRELVSLVRERVVPPAPEQLAPLHHHRL